MSSIGTKSYNPNLVKLELKYFPTIYFKTIKYLYVCCFFGTGLRRKVFCCTHTHLSLTPDLLSHGRDQQQNRQTS
jgi:hypothetical protein